MNKPEIRVEHIDMPIIYVRFKGSYMDFRKKSRSLFNHLFDYAQTYELIDEGVTKVLTIYHDNPFITKEAQLRTSVAMTVPMQAETPQEGQIGSLRLQGRYAVLTFELGLGEYGEAWRYAYDEYLLDHHEYHPRDAAPFELYVNEPPKDSKGKSMVAIYLPIE